MKKALLLTGLLALITISLWCGREWNTQNTNARAFKLNDEVENLFVGLQKFKERVGVYPLGSNSEIVKALNGHNQKNVIILVGRKTELNEKGEIIDPWGTPLRIYFSDAGVLVRSAGPNRRFDDTTSVEFDDFIRSN
jgi:hypothetical protein